MLHSGFGIRSMAIIAITISLALSAIGLQATPALAQGGDNVVIVTTGALHIRSGPAPNMTVIGTVPAGAELTVTGRNVGTTWWRVDSPFGMGWVNADYVVFRGLVDAVPVLANTGGTLEIPTVYVHGLPVTVYGSPSTDSFVIGIIPSGVSLVATGLSTDGNWWQVATSMGTGWVSVAAVALRGDAKLIPFVSNPGPSFAGPTVRLNSDTAVTSQPGSGDVVTTLAAGTLIEVRGRNTDNTWWQVVGDFGFGWIPVNNVSLSGSAANIPLANNTYAPAPAYTGAAVMYAVVESERKVAYAEDSYDSAPMWDARLGEQLGVLSRNTTGLWLEVIKANGWQGWMNFSGLTLLGDMMSLPINDMKPVFNNIVIINIHRLNVRSGPGVEYTDLTSVPGGTELSVTGRHPTLPWIRVTGDFGEGWVRIMHIIFRGDWNAVPRVTEPAGVIQMPQAIIHAPHLVYSVPVWDMPTGQSIQPGLYTILAWAPYYKWAQIRTELGDVWIQREEFEIRGIAENAPIVP